VSAPASLLTDLVHAARALRRRPLLPLAAVSALALGIGASTAVFSVVDAVLLRPLPFARPERLMVLGERSPQRGHLFVEVSYPDYRDWQAQSRMFSSMAILPTANQRLTLGGDEPSRVQARLVSGNFFDVLGAAAARGRVLAAGDDQVGAARVAVLSDGLWRGQFGADAGLLGRSILLDGTPTTVVGVMPPAFAYPPGAELWIPFVPAAGDLVEKRQVGWTMVLGRLADGATVAQATEEMDGIVARLEAQHVPAAYAEERKASVQPFPEEFLGTAHTALPVLLAAVVLVLLLACANVSALLLARAGERRREMALRLALGASRARLVRGLLAESGLLALAGGLAGVLLSTWILGLLQVLVPADVPRLAQASIDGRVLAFALLLTGGAALLAGLAPASMASRPSLVEDLADGARTAGPGGGHPRLRALLLAGQAAAVLVLLAGAGLLIRTFENLRRVDLGYDARRLLAFELSTPPGRYASAAQQRELYRAVLERIDALPGVEASAGVLLRPLWSEHGMDWPFQVEGQPLEEALRNPLLNLEAVTPAYFRTMRIPILRGRAFEARDADGAEGVVIVSEAVARRYWPGREAVGQRLKIPLLDSPYHDTWLTVVGVAADVRYRELGRARLDLYMSNLQSREWLNHVVVRTAGDPLALVPAVKTAVRSVDRGLAMSATTTMEAAVGEALGGPRFQMQLLSAFALAALLLAALGIYGVVAFVVGHRTREIGLRMALGASTGDVARLVLRRGLAPVLGGLAAGMAAALVLARTLSGLLFGVEARDPATLAGAAAVLAAVALLACALPAARAARVDPAVALRQE
jgi:putative ABC transport system permease protein